MARQGGEALKPWERQPGEGQRAFAAFELYRDLGDERSLHKVAKQLTKSDALIRRWSARWNWVERVTAWDDELARQRVAAKIKAAREMNEQQDKVGVLLIQRGTEILDSLDPEDGAYSDVVKLVELGVKLRRLAHGEPTEIEEQHRMPQFVEVVVTTEPPPEPEEEPDGSISGDSK